MAASPAPDPAILVELAVRYDDATGIVHIAGQGFRTTVHADPAHRRGHRHLHGSLLAMLEEAGPFQRKVTARQMADAAGIKYLTFRNALWRAKRRGELRWHQKSAVWEARVGSPEHRDMQRIIAPLLHLGEAWRVRR